MIKTTDLPATKTASESDKDEEARLRQLIEHQKKLEAEKNKRDKHG